MSLGIVSSICIRNRRQCAGVRLGMLECSPTLLLCLIGECMCHAQQHKKDASSWGQWHVSGNTPTFPTTRISGQAGCCWVQWHVSAQSECCRDQWHVSGSTPTCPETLLPIPCNS